MMCDQKCLKQEEHLALLLCHWNTWPSSTHEQPQTQAQRKNYSEPLSLWNHTFEIP